MDANEMLNAQGPTLNAQSMGKAQWPMLNHDQCPKLNEVQVEPAQMTADGKSRFIEA